MPRGLVYRLPPMACDGTGIKRRRRRRGGRIIKTGVGFWDGFKQGWRGVMRPAGAIASMIPDARAQGVGALFSALGGLGIKRRRHRR